MDTFLFGAALVAGSTALFTGFLILLALAVTFVVGLRRWRRGDVLTRRRRRRLLSVRPSRQQTFGLQRTRAPHHPLPPPPAPLPISPARVSRTVEVGQGEDVDAFICPAAAGALE